MTKENNSALSISENARTIPTKNLIRLLKQRNNYVSNKYQVIISEWLNQALKKEGGHTDIANIIEAMRIPFQSFDGLQADHLKILTPQQMLIFCTEAGLNFLKQDEFSEHLTKFFEGLKDFLHWLMEIVKQGSELSLPLKKLVLSVSKLDNFSSNHDKLAYLLSDDVTQLRIMAIIFAQNKKCWAQSRFLRRFAKTALSHSFSPIQYFLTLKGACFGLSFERIKHWLATEDNFFTHLEKCSPSFQKRVLHQHNTQWDESNELYSLYNSEKGLNVSVAFSGTMNCNVLDELSNNTLQLITLRLKDGLHAIAVKKLSIGYTLYDPSEPTGELFFLKTNRLQQHLDNFYQHKVTIRSIVSLTKNTCSVMCPMRATQALNKLNNLNGTHARLVSWQKKLVGKKSSFCSYYGKGKRLKKLAKRGLRVQIFELAKQAKRLKKRHLYKEAMRTALITGGIKLEQLGSLPEHIRNSQNMGRALQHFQESEDTLKSRAWIYRVLGIQPKAVRQFVRLAKLYRKGASKAKQALLKQQALTHIFTHVFTTKQDMSGIEVKDTHTAKTFWHAFNDAVIQGQKNQDIVQPKDIITLEV